MCGVWGRFGVDSNGNTSSVLLDLCRAVRAVIHFCCNRAALGTLDRNSRTTDD